MGQCYHAPNHDGQKLTSQRNKHDTEGRILFVSDAHFGDEGEASERDRVDRFLRFLRFARRRARTLYIVGDLFDFWFEYRQVLPKTHVPILAEVAALARDGMDVWYIAGNHDYWIGDFFRRTVGIRVSHEPVTLEMEGRRIYVTHGDEMTAGHDSGYRFLRRMVRSRLAIGLFHWIHPDLGIPLARWASHVSRGYSTQKKFVLNRTLDAAIRSRFREGYDAVVMGHIHYADHLRYGKEECIMLGDWIDAFTYAEFEGGRFRLGRFEAEEE